MEAPVLHRRRRCLNTILSILLLSAVLGTTSGCGDNISKTLDSWIGHNSNELIGSWGPPSQVFSDGKGGTVFVYGQSREWITPGYGTTNYSFTPYGGTATTVYTPARVNGYTAYRMFWADSDGKIYSWAWKGL